MDAESATSTSHDSPIRHVSAPSPGSAAEALRAADLPAEANTKWRRAVLLQGAAATYGRNLAAAEAASFRATVAPRSSASFSGIPTIPDSAAGVSRLAAPETSVSSAAEALRAAGLEEGAAYVHPSYTRRSPSDSASSAAGVSRLAAPETSVSSAAEALRATDSGKSAAYERNPSSVKSAAELDDVAAYYDRRHYSPSRAADPPRRRRRRRSGKRLQKGGNLKDHGQRLPRRRHRSLLPPQLSIVMIHHRRRHRSLLPPSISRGLWVHLRLSIRQRSSGLRMHLSPPISRSLRQIWQREWRTVYYRKVYHGNCPQKPEMYIHLHGLLILNHGLNVVLTPVRMLAK